MGKSKRAPRQAMPEQAPEKRRRNFDEVPLGYSPEVAIIEASRCVKCKKPVCVGGCPVGVKIPEFIALVQAGEFLAAARKLKEDNYLPAICGRVCPQEDQCEKVCVLARTGEPVAIGRLERFAADYEREHGTKETPPLSKLAGLPVPQCGAKTAGLPAVVPHSGTKAGHRVAIIGSGPASLTVAGDLALKGHDVTILEALHKTGGVLVYGIPEFRLPKKIVQEEIDYLKTLGVKIEVNKIVGKTMTIDDLFAQGYEAVFIGVGAGLPRFLGIPGENLVGVYSANEYLTRSNLMKAYLFPQYSTPLIKSERTVVVGGGNVAMDSARTALRLGSEVTLVYRRSKVEMPARIEEVHHAEEEGVNFMLLTDPVEVLGDDKGRVRGIRCLRMELGEPDKSGRRRPVPIKGSEFEMACAAVIIAIGNKANPLLTRATPGLELNSDGNIVADPVTMQTSRPRVFAGGDIVTGAATVIEAMGAGKKAARAIDRLLNGGVGG